MTQQVDVAHGRDIIARWCVLAEQRLEHLTELFETGRWRRYHGEREFLENIREARVAVETWRSLATREASLDNSAIDLSWLGRGRAPREREMMRDQPSRVVPPPAAISDPAPASSGSIVPAARDLRAEIADSVVAMGLTPDIAEMERRYPLLHNVL